PVLLRERLDRGLAIDHRGDDLALLGHLLTAHHDPVAVADRRVDHRVADHLQQEQIAVAHKAGGQGEHVLHLLLRGDRDAGGDPGSGAAGGSGESSSPGSTTSIARGRLGSRRRNPLRSSAWSWWDTEDEEVSPTASPISRIEGG